MHASQGVLRGLLLGVELSLFGYGLRCYFFTLPFGVVPRTRELKNCRPSVIVEEVSAHWLQSLPSTRIICTVQDCGQRLRGSLPKNL